MARSKDIDLYMATSITKVLSSFPFSSTADNCRTGQNKPVVYNLSAA